MAEALLRLGIGIEPGLSKLEDAEALLSTDLAERSVRILVEPVDEHPVKALATAAAIEALLRGAGVRTRQLHHGAGATAWPVLEASLRRGHDVRIGLEDTLELPNGHLARHNGELVEAARRLIDLHGLRLEGQPG